MGITSKKPGTSGQTDAIESLQRERDDLRAALEEIQAMATIETQKVCDVATRALGGAE